MDNIDQLNLIIGIIWIIGILPVAIIYEKYFKEPFEQDNYTGSMLAIVWPIAFTIIITLGLIFTVIIGPIVIVSFILRFVSK